MSTETNGSNGRRTDGTFAVGNRGGPGNPHSRRMHELRRELLDAVEPGTIKAVVDKLSELAKGGDIPAAKLLLDHAIGRPTQAIELSGPDGAPLADVAALQVVILNALADEPAARFKVAAALRGLSRNADPDRDGHAGPGS
jgi:hypothetical protein